MRNSTNALMSDDSSLPSYTVAANDECKLAVLRALEIDGFVGLWSQTSTSVSWRFTGHGAKSIAVATCVRDPGSLFAPRRGISSKLSSTIDLVGAIQADGWKLQIWDSGAKEAHSGSSGPPPLNTSTGKPKIWWIDARKPAIRKNYLLCLLNVKGLKIEFLEHLRPDNYYQLVRKVLILIQFVLAWHGPG